MYVEHESVAPSPWSCQVCSRLQASAMQKPSGSCVRLSWASILWSRSLGDWVMLLAIVSVHCWWVFDQQRTCHLSWCVPKSCGNRPQSPYVATYSSTVTWPRWKRDWLMKNAAVGDAANRLAVSRQRDTAMTIRPPSHILTATDQWQPQFHRLTRALLLLHHRCQSMWRCRRVHRSSYLPLLLLLPGGIPHQETSVSTSSSDCSGVPVWAVINARSLCNKLDEFHLCLSDRNIDVCYVTETWLNNSIPDSFACPKDYCVYRHDRTGVGGGAAVFVKKCHLLCCSRCTSRVQTYRSCMCWFIVFKCWVSCYLCVKTWF